VGREFASEREKTPIRVPGALADFRCQVSQRTVPLVAVTFGTVATVKHFLF
jgi:hypothetical protein